ncbi:uncharacterized protein A1O5_00416 [Cladophialophora psammophila CBS 110553]|uniref:Uncharacterized protein n=1 Tax=Cladophialophora psammophila CBS 110553 TaxID=1182543 RepID=W9X6T9_9EURO|nr:uncharacterized protein A1O5_00416 [Cladophialophora psammophila CBS 110553]EXJ75908.1 hypothetical protein A1O5_00416 [Cladophialophora psammophila CBS 110553]
MDPATLLSVVSSVVSFVEFGTKLICKSKEIYKSAEGVLTDHAEQAAVSSRLAQLSRGLMESQTKVANGKKLSPAEQALVEVLLECKEAAESFTMAIDELGSVWKEEGIEERLAKLDRLRQQAIIHLLVVVNDGIKQEVQKLAEDLKKLADEQRKRRRDYQLKETGSVQLLDQWRIQNEDALDLIAQSVQEKDEQAKKKSHQRKVLDALLFDRIDDSESKIDPKAEVTLDWAFNPPAKYQSQWSDMSAWLQGPDSLYWVSGKAGSGKSTLMKWLLYESRTKELLESWAGNKKLLTANYFFWSSGSSLQKSFSGLLRSLLYNLLRQWPQSTLPISPARWRSYDLELEYFPARTESDLLIAVHTIIQDTAQDARVCLFIDGLDECAEHDTHRTQILELLKELSASLMSKSKNSNLRLELLNRNDIEKYITAELQADDKFKALRENNHALCSKLVTEILDKAGGVFLRVVLVIRSLLRGLEHKDTIADLLDRLSQIPSELEAYFCQMLSGIDKVYRSSALKLLKIALNSVDGLSLMTCSFLDEVNPNCALNVPTKAVSAHKIEERLTETASRINVRCLGLLETKTLRGDRRLMCRDSVDFLHRMARDFLLDNPEILLQMEAVASFTVHRFVCETVVAQMKMTDAPTKDFSKPSCGTLESSKISLPSHPCIYSTT